MVATTTTTEKGLSIKVADSDFTLVDILSDIDMRTGTPVDETAWLDGGAAAGSYPGAIDGFVAKNTNTTNANGSLRLVTFTVNIVQATTVEPLLFSAGASKIIGIVGLASATSAKDVTATMTNTGLTGASVTVAPLATGGSLPCLILESESANQVCHVTVLILN
jgi:hypothetical protein